MKNITRAIQDNRQKEFVKKFDSICVKHNRWTVWSDFVTAAAIEFSNTVDDVHKPERTKHYQTLTEKYSATEKRYMAEMLGDVICGMDENPDQDFLGELYMFLNLGNEHAGQFFTPYNVCKCMAAMNTPDIKQMVDKQGWISVNDPTCGAGALLVAFANECRNQNVNFQTSVLFVAQDIDFTVGLMCYLQLSLMGCAGYVVIGDSLLHPTVSYDARGLIPQDEGNIWYTPMYFRDVWHWRRIWAKMEPIFHSEAIPPDTAPEETVAPGDVITKTTPARVEFITTETGQLTLF